MRTLLRSVLSVIGLILGIALVVWLVGRLVPSLLAGTVGNLSSPGGQGAESWLPLEQQLKPYWGFTGGGGQGGGGGGGSAGGD